MNKPSVSRSVGELFFSELAFQTSPQVRAELELADAETSAKASMVDRAAALVAGGAAVAMLGSMALLAALIVVLSAAIPLWASALVVGLVVGVGGVAIASSGIRAWRTAQSQAA
jgi:hypothetical protein